MPIAWSTDNIYVSLTPFPYYFGSGESVDWYYAPMRLTEDRLL